MRTSLDIPIYWIRPATHTFTCCRDAPGSFGTCASPPPESVEHEYPISAIYHDTPRYPLGPAALPGRYTVKLTVDGRSYTRPPTIKMDPRVKDLN